jgi:uncharacterized membrane protein
MTKGRLEAFGDAVIAIIITIMVLELHAPDEPTLAALTPLAPKFLSYALSFVFLAIYWNNHHHLFQSVQRVNGAVLWANIHLLFWLSLVPFATAWLGESPLAPLPVALYGLVLTLAALAYYVLVRELVSLHGPESPIATAIGKDVKGKASLALYGAALALSPFVPAASLGIYVLLVILWLVPDRRFELRGPS